MLAEQFGVRPWEMGRLRPSELERITKTIKAQEKAARDAERRNR